MSIALHVHIFKLKTWLFRLELNLNTVMQQKDTCPGKFLIDISPLCMTAFVLPSQSTPKLFVIHDWRSRSYCLSLYLYVQGWQPSGQGGFFRMTCFLWNHHSCRCFCEVKDHCTYVTSPTSLSRPNRTNVGLGNKSAIAVIRAAWGLATVICIACMPAYWDKPWQQTCTFPRVHAGCQSSQRKTEIRLQATKQKANKKEKTTYSVYISPDMPENDCDGKQGGKRWLLCPQRQRKSRIGRATSRWKLAG